MALGEEVEPQRRPLPSRPPATIVAFIALIALVDLVQIIGGGDRNQGFPYEEPLVIALVNIFRFTFPLLFLSLVAVGLWNRLRWVWVIALAWQLLGIMQGAFNILINGYEARYITSFTQIGFFHGALPIGAGILGGALLLWPSTVRWIRDR